MPLYPPGLRKGDADMLELYKNIKRLREEKGMSQDSLAKLTGYTDRSSIAKIEKGQVDLQQSKIELFARALGATSQELMGWADPDGETDREYLLFQNLFKRQGFQLGYYGNPGPAGPEGEPLFYTLLTANKTDYQISSQEYHSLTREIDSFVRFRLNDLADEEHKRKPVKKESSKLTAFPAPDRSYLAVDAAHVRTDIPGSAFTEELLQQDEDIMDSPDF